MSKNKNIVWTFVKDKPCSIWARLILFFAISISACKQDKGTISTDTSNDKIIAKVFDKEVHASEITYLNKKDSAAIVNNYLDRLIEEEALYQKANGSELISEQEIEEKTNQFRKSLLSLAYQNKFLEQHLDTNIQEEELKKYHEKNASSLLLRTNIFKGLYVVIPSNTSKNVRIKELILSQKPSDKLELKNLCSRYASAYSIDDNTWSAMPSQIGQLVGFNEMLVGQYIRNKQLLSFEKDDNLYLVRLFDFKFAKQPSPYSFSKEEIKQSLLNKRKMQLLIELRRQLLSEAKSNKKIEIY